jgi:hypothetical protein
MPNALAGANVNAQQQTSHHHNVQNPSPAQIDIT